MLTAYLRGEIIRASPGVMARCPGCDDPVIPKCGPIVTWHWAHKAGHDCDDWYQPETEWHRRLKLLFYDAGAYIEQTVKRYGQHHRADIILPDGRIIELQHDYLDARKIQARERFWGNMMWLYLEKPGWEDRWWQGRWKTDRPNMYLWSRGPRSWLEHHRPIYVCAEEDLGFAYIYSLRIWEHNDKLYIQTKPIADSIQEWIERLVPSGTQFDLLASDRPDRPTA